MHTPNKSMEANGKRAKWSMQLNLCLYRQLSAAKGPSEVGVYVYNLIRDRSLMRLFFFVLAGCHKHNTDWNKNLVVSLGVSWNYVVL